MTQITKSIFNDKTRKMIVNLGIKKGKINNKSSPQLTRLHNSLLMSIVKTPESNLSNVEGGYDMRKVRTSLAKSSLRLFLCSMRAMYNRELIMEKNFSC